MWIGAEHATNDFNEFGDVVIATSTRSSSSLVSPYRITLMKLIKIKDGEYKAFKYGTDILSLKSSTKEEIESIIFKDGNFLYIETNPINGSRKVK